MAVTTTTRSVSYTASGAETSFAVPFRFLEDGHLVVVLDGATQTLGADYTVQGAGGASGSVVPASSFTGDLVITRVVPLLQETSLRSYGSFSPAVHETALDLLTMEAQQLDAEREALAVLQAADVVALAASVTDEAAERLAGDSAEAVSRLAGDSAEIVARAAEDALIRAQLASAALGGGVNVADTSTVLPSGGTASRTLANWIAQLVAAQTEAWQSSTKNFIFEGDSNMAGGALPVGADWPTQAMLLPQFAGRGTKHNVALGGDQIASIIANYASQVFPLRPAVTGVPAILFVAIGTNDVAGASTSAALFSALSGYWTTAKADGFTVVAFTIPGLELLGPRQLVRRDLNKLIRGSTIYDYLVDLDALFPDPWDTTVFGDGTHFTADAAKKVASAVNDVLALPRSHALAQPSPYMLYPVALGTLRVGAGGWSDQGVIRLPNGQTIGWRNGAGTGDINAIFVDPSNHARLGTGAALVVIANPYVLQENNADSFVAHKISSGLTAAQYIYLQLADRSVIQWEIQKPSDNHFIIFDKVTGMQRLRFLQGGNSEYRTAGASSSHVFQNSAGAQVAAIAADGTNTLTLGANKMGWAAAAPVAGTWAKGDVIWNTGVAAGGSPGWSCTTAGTPGTWKAMANVAP